MRQRGVVHAHLVELLEHRVGVVSLKSIQDYSHLAHVAGFHELSLAIYHARRQERGDTDTSTPTTGAFLASSYIVDSAYALKSSAELVRLAADCADRVLARRDQRSTRQLLGEFALFRCFWRCVCLAELFHREESSGKHSDRGASRSVDALADAAVIYESSIKRLYGDRGLNTGTVLRHAQRMVKYDTSGDAGEMLFFQWCTSEGIMPPPTTLHEVSELPPVTPANAPGAVNDEELPLSPPAFTGNGGSEAAASPPSTGVSAGPPHHASAGSGSVSSISTVSDLELFYATLIGTCLAGKHGTVAMNYFDLVRRRLGWDSLLEEREVSTSTAGDDVSTVLTSSRTPVSEYVVYCLLNVLQATRDHQRVVKLARTLIAERNDISVSVWNLLLFAAGETRAVDVALAAHHSAVTALSGAGDRGASSAPRGLDFLLQTSLNALSKCQLRHFEKDYLAPARQEGILRCGDEFYFGCLLQDAHNSMNPLEKASDIRQRMESRGVPYTTMLVSRFLKLYLRMESPEFLPMYTHAVHTLGLFRASWLSELLLWADRRRYSLSQKDREFIMQEARRVSGDPASTLTTSQVTEEMGQVRSHYALLAYDYEVQPCEHFQRNGTPPTTAPSTLDSRVHFLLKRPYSVLQGLATTSESTTAGSPLWRSGDSTNAPAVNGEDGAGCGFIGDPARKAEAAELADLSGALLTVQDSGSGKAAASQTEEVFRVYLADMLEGLQRSNNYVA